MAIPNARISFTIRDSEGDESVMTLYSNETLTVLVPLLPAMKGNIEAISDAAVAKIELTRQDPTPVNTVPGGNVDNEIQAKFAFYTSDATVSQVSVPGFDRTKLEPNTDRVDTADADVVAFIDMLTTGAANIVDVRGADLSGLKSALESYSRRR